MYAGYRYTTHWFDIKALYLVVTKYREVWAGGERNLLVRDDFGGRDSLSWWSSGMAKLSIKHQDFVPGQISGLTMNINHELWKGI